MESPAESHYRPRARERIYRGRFRVEDGRHEVSVDGWRPLVHIVRQSPDGFAWGYDGPSPNDLALALLADALGEDPEPGWSDGPTLSDDLYRTFQLDVLRRIPPEKGWMLRRTHILRWVGERVPACRLRIPGDPA
jgi:Family of unknown function (DUF6166)